MSTNLRTREYKFGATEPRQLGVVQNVSAWPHFRGYELNNNGYSSYYGPESNGIKWKYTTSNSVVSSPVLDANGNIYVGSLDFYMYSLNPVGSLNWSFRTGGSISGSAVIGKNGNIYFGSADLNFYCLTPKGSRLWATNVGNGIRNSPVMGPDGTIYFNANSELFAISPTGSLKWTFSGGTTFVFGSSSPTVSISGVVYIGTNSQGMIAIQPNDTFVVLLWQSDVSRTLISTTAAISNDHKQVIFGSNDFNLYSLDALTGKLIWNYATADSIQSSAAIGKDGMIYFGSNDNYLYGLYPNGSFHCKFLTGDNVGSSPAIDRNGSVFFGSFDGNVYGLNSHCQLLWTYVGDSNIQSSPAIATSADLFIGSANNNILAIQGHPPSPSAPSTVSGLTAIEIIIIIVFSVFGFCVCLVCILFCLLRRSLKLFNRATGRNEDEWADIGVLFSSNLSIHHKRGSFPSAGAFSVDDIIVPKINWSEIKLEVVDDIQSLILGRGSFGTVYRAKMEIFDSELKTKRTEDVVVKVITDSVSSAGGLVAAPGKEEEAFKQAKFEAAVVIATENRMYIKEAVIKVYGIAQGQIPSHLSKPLHISANTKAIGIVMRCEGGGSLKHLLHRKDDPEAPPLDMMEKLRILTELAKGIADMHAAGIIHGDLKPDNVLLSSHFPCKVRLADFGLATLRDHNTLDASTLSQTASTKGTPVYCAPEMFVNPYAAVLEDKVAKASRKTDMYAFALIAWEVLTQTVPFEGIQKETLLVATIYSGTRPPIDALPPDCSRELVQMIQATWDTERTQRMTAIECFNILQYELYSLSKHQYDIYISYEATDYRLAKYIAFRLTQENKIACMIRPSNKKAGDNGSLEEIQRSHMLLSLLTVKYQGDSHCMAELTNAKNQKPPKKIFPVLLQSSIEDWSNYQLLYLCQLNSTAVEKVDLSACYKDIYDIPWSERSSEVGHAAAVQLQNEAKGEVLEALREFHKSKSISKFIARSISKSLFRKNNNSSNVGDGDEGNKNKNGSSSSRQLANGAISQSKCVEIVSPPIESNGFPHDGELADPVPAVVDLQDNDKCSVRPVLDEHEHDKQHSNTHRRLSTDGIDYIFSEDLMAEIDKLIKKLVDILSAGNSASITNSNARNVAQRVTSMRLNRSSINSTMSSLPQSQSSPDTAIAKSRTSRGDSDKLSTIASVAPSIDDTRESCRNSVGRSTDRDVSQQRIMTEMNSSLDAASQAYGDIDMKSSISSSAMTSSPIQRSLESQQQQQLPATVHSTNTDLSQEYPGDKYIIAKTISIGISNSDVADTES